MRIAIHDSTIGKSFNFAPRWIKSAKEIGIEVLCIDFKKYNTIKNICGCDGAMWHWAHFPDDKQSAPKILDAIESGLRIPVFPNKETRWHYDEKIAQNYFFDAISAPKIKTWIFWNMDEALEFVEEAEYPLVFKLSVGAGSANILKVESKEEAIKLVELIFGVGLQPYSFNEFNKKEQQQGGNNIYDDQMNHPLNYKTQANLWDININSPFHRYYMIQKNYVYFQEFLPENKYDIRITIIGNRAFGFIRHNRANDFRASGSGIIDYDMSKIHTDAVDIAHRISMDNNFQSMAYDFLYDKTGKVVISEISYCYQNLAIYNCPGYWDREQKWHEGHIWPEEAQLIDFIHYVKNGQLI
jgi:hypothetical protein